mmetsp:Transcript_4914/g.15332  ORF Transcript_4914/g.15332 Transcript_4914/m.15332 type:complete len:208 (-) Transcript_4914:1026-1649(-)
MVAAPVYLDDQPPAESDTSAKYMGRSRSRSASPSLSESLPHVHPQPAARAHPRARRPHTRETHARTGTTRRRDTGTRATWHVYIMWRAESRAMCMGGFHAHGRAQGRGGEGGNPRCRRCYRPPRCHGRSSSCSTCRSTSGTTWPSPWTAPRRTSSASSGRSALGPRSGRGCCACSRGRPWRPWRRPRPPECPTASRRNGCRRRLGAK